MEFLKFIKNLFHKKPQKHQFFFHLSLDKKENLQLVRQYVMHVSRHFDEPEEFKMEAAKIASHIGKDRIPLLFYLLQENHLSNSGGQDQDMSFLFRQVLENTIFEILYHLGEDAYPMLFNYAFYSDKKMSFKPVEVLCRMAAEGIHREEILQEINANIDYASDRQILPLLHALSLIQKNKKVDAIFSRFVKRYLEHCHKHPKNLRRGLSIIRRWANSSIEAPKVYLPMLKDIALGINQKRKYSNNCNEDVKKLERVRAALVYNYMNPSDMEIQQQFNKWLLTEDNPEVRQYMMEQLDENKRQRGN